MHTSIQAPLYVCGGQRMTTCWSWLSPSTLWVLGTELRFSGIATSNLPAKPSPRSLLTSYLDLMPAYGMNGAAHIQSQSSLQSWLSS